MAKIYAFFNPLAGNGGCAEDVSLLELVYDDPIFYCDMTQPETYARWLFALQPEDKLILCGGDGTVHRFLNLVQDIPIPCDILLFPLGTRNHFAQTLRHRFGDAPFSVKEWLLRSPSVTANGQTRHFLGRVEFAPPDRHFPRKRYTAFVCADGAGRPLRKTGLALTRQKDALLLLHGRRRKNSLSGQQFHIDFDRPVTILADGEMMCQTKSCRFTTQVR